MLRKNRPALGGTPWGVTASEHSKLRLTTRNLSFQELRLDTTPHPVQKLLKSAQFSFALTSYFDFNQTKDLIITKF